MQLNLPYKFDEKTMNISTLELQQYPYIVTTNGVKIMTKEEIIERMINIDKQNKSEIR